MRKHCAGFSLMDSLVTLLVLSIGMLGLGQLQVRLWASSGDLHSLESAHLAAANMTELIEIKRTFTLENKPGLILPDSNFPSDLSFEHWSNSRDSTRIHLVKVYWERPSGNDEFSLESTVYTAFNVADVRWLLPVWQKQPPIGSEIPLIP